jgi:hypothetical protein
MALMKSVSLSLARSFMQLRHIQVFWPCLLFGSIARSSLSRYHVPGLA